MKLCVCGGGRERDRKKDYLNMLNVSPCYNATFIKNNSNVNKPYQLQILVHEHSFKTVIH